MNDTLVVLAGVLLIAALVALGQTSCSAALSDPHQVCVDGVCVSVPGDASALEKDAAGS